MDFYLFNAAMFNIYHVIVEMEALYILAWL